jgi:hypothetical protein
MNPAVAQALAMVLLLCATSAAAQSEATRSELLRVWVSEAGWRAPRSYAAMGAILARDAARYDRSIVASADRLVWQYSNAQADHAWVRYLDAGCARPDHWKGIWQADRCLAVVALVDRFLDGALPDPCKGQASGWRTPHSKALHKALRKNALKRVRCAGGTYLAFVGPR